MANSHEGDLELHCVSYGMHRLAAHSQRTGSWRQWGSRSGSASCCHCQFSLVVTAAGRRAAQDMTGTDRQSSVPNHGHTSALVLTACAWQRAWER